MSQPDWNIFIDYLTGEISAEDKETFEKWLGESDENEKYFETVKNIWNTRPVDFPAPDTEAALKDVLSRIDANGQKIFNLKQAGKPKPDFVFILASRFFKAAAIVFFVIGAFYFYRIVTSEFNNVKITKTFERLDTLVLSDGSSVIADAGTTLEYLKKLPRLGTREIKLSGEAYFEVTHNEKTPFKVNTREAIVTVLGTKFSVRDWGNENETVVAVAGGKVSLRSITYNADEKSVILTHGQMSSVTAGKQPLPAQDVNIGDYLSWMKREMYFRNTPLKNVIAQIERWYRVKIILSQPALLENKVTVFIQNKPVEENIKLICSIFNLKPDYKKNEIRLSPALQ